MLLFASGGVPGVEPQFVAGTLAMRAMKNNRMFVERAVAQGYGAETWRRTTNLHVIVCARLLLACYALQPAQLLSPSTRT